MLSCTKDTSQLSRMTHRRPDKKVAREELHQREHGRRERTGGTGHAAGKELNSAR